MIDMTKVVIAERFKKARDAAYVVFRKTPSTSNATKWTAASRNFTDFCVNTMTDLIKEKQEGTISKPDILADFESYKTCKKCGTQVLYLANKDNYVATSDFVEEFKGWCYNCLVEYCTTHECEGCGENPRLYTDSCPFREVKNFYLEGLEEELPEEGTEE
jgi:hypothetical protein